MMEEEDKIVQKTSRIRLIKDKMAGSMMLTFTLVSVLLVVLIGIGLVLKSLPILHDKSLWELLSGAKWKPMRGDFGFLWGILVVVPWISDRLAPHFVEYSTGYSTLAAGIVLGIMILPLLISLFVELFSSVPKEYREASLSLGATRWQTTKYVLLKKTFPGIVASVTLAISRAMGETIAVLMVCGNIVQLPDSLFDGCYPLPALIANNYGEMLSLPLYESALMFAALILFVVVFVFNIASRLILRKLERNLV